MGDMPQFLNAFPHYPMEAFPLIPEGFKDVSWHNDACPSIANEALDLLVMIDWPEQKDRELEAFLRFNAMRYIDKGEKHEDLLQTDDWAEVLAYIAKLTSDGKAR